MFGASARDGSVRQGDATMFENDADKQESIAPGRLQCPYCNEFVEGISARGPGARILKPCDHVVSDAGIDVSDAAEHVQAIDRGDGVTILRDRRTAGTEDWVESDTTADELGVANQ